jgi:CHAT domain-containing protein/tetratricopeptide (TPR) repeat protein
VAGVSCNVRWLLLIALTAVFATAQAASFEDAPVKRWSELFWQGDAQATLNAIEADLASAAPHPYAAESWCQLHRRIGDLPAATESARRLGYGQGVANLCDVLRLADVNANVQILGKYLEYARSHSEDIWFANAIADAATAVGRLDEEADLLLLAVSKNPDQFQLVWQLTDAVGENLARRARLRNALNSGEIAPDSAAAQALKLFLSAPSWDSAERIAVGRLWLAKLPKDPRAQTMLSVTLNELRRFAEAAPLLQDAMREYPFNLSGGELVLALDRLQRTAEAQHFVEQAAAGSVAGTEQAQQLFAQWWALDLRYSGNRGLARQVIATALAKWPAVAEIQDAAGNIESDDQRYAEAETRFRAAVQIKPQAIAYRNELMEAYLHDKQARQVLKQFDEIRAAGLQPTLQSYYLVGEADKSLGDTKATLAISAEAREKFPVSAWAMRDQAEALYDLDRKPEAIALVRKAVDEDPDHLWGIQKWAQWTCESLTKADCASRIVDLGKQYPWNESVWQQMIDRAGMSESQAWQEARTVNPLAGFAVWHQVWIVEEGDKPEDVLTLAQSLPAQFEAAAPTDRALSIGIFPAIAADLSTKQRLSDEQLNGALSAIDDYLAAGGHLGRAIDWRSQLLSALGRRKEAAEASLAEATLTDSEDGFERPLMDFADELGPRAWMLVQQALDRHPMNPKTVEAYVHAHSLWGGSPVVALHALEDARKRGVPNVSGCDCQEAKAYGQLGDSVKEYELMYARSTSIGGSDRYVSWYDSDRVGIAAGHRTRIRLVEDPNGAAVDVTYPNGVVMRRVDNPTLGKVVRVSSGPAFVQADYDKDSGNLRRISSGAGTWLNIEYNDQGLVRRVSASNSKVVEISAYNTAGKPLRIEAPGIGALDVTYDSDNNIKSVQGSGPKGQSAHNTARQVSSLFEDLIQQTQLLDQANRSSQPPELPFVDAKHEQLKQVYEDSSGVAEQRAALTLARYDEANLNISIGYGDEARRALVSVIESVGNLVGSPVKSELEVQAIDQWMRLVRLTRPDGITADDLARWIRFQSRLATLAQEGNAPAKEVQERMATVPQTLDDPWFRSTKIGNPGYWRRYGNEALMPDSRREAQKHAVLVRRNGDVLVGTAAGFTVRHLGYWTAYSFDSQQERFTRNPDDGPLDERSDVLSLAETQDGTLWLGTAGGLMAVLGDYDAEPRVWRTQADGLPAPRIESLASAGQQLWIGTSAGLRFSDGAGLHAVDPRLDGVPVKFIQVSEAAVADKDDATGADPTEGTAPSAADEAIISVGITGGVYVKRHSSWQQLLDHEADGVVYSSEAALFLVLEGTQVREIRWDDTHPAEVVGTLSGAQTLKYSRQIYGLTLLPIDDDKSVPALLTDIGISLYRDWHFESMPLALEVERHGVVLGPRQSASASAGSWFTTAEGVYGFERGRALIQPGGRVYDLLADNDQGYTFIARGDHIDAADQAHPEAEPKRFSDTATTALARDASGGLIANDGHTILRFAKGEAEASELFSAEPSAPGQWQGDGFGNILVAHDGAIWVAAGSSVFRYQDGNAEEFNWFVDSEKFPARSEMISRVIETVRGEILVVASNESHIKYQGVALEGGLLRYNGTGFDRVKDAQYTGSVFLTGYTPLNATTAIVGTASGFVREQDGKLTTFAKLKDPSYARLAARNPTLWLGRNGAPLGDGNWLIPSAAGLLVYRDGEWYFPDRLNDLLPMDPELGQYGGRTVHAVAVDNHGNIYAGNDSGLLIYQHANSPTELFIESGHAVDLFADQGVRAVQAEGDVLLKHVKAGSAAGQLVAGIQAMDSEIDLLKSAKPEMGVAVSALAASARTEEGRAGAAGAGAEPSPELGTVLRQREQNRARLLDELERTNYGLFRMLKLDPQDLATLHAKLSADQVVLQFIPDTHKLYIQAVTKEGSTLYESDVPANELDAAVGEVAQALAFRARRLHVSEAPSQGAKDQEGLRTLSTDLPVAVEQLDDEALNTKLEWLYDQLLRPATYSIKGKRQVFIVPVGRLNYLPFAALRDRSGKAVRYAAEEYNLGILPSMFQLDLMLRHQPSRVAGNLVIGDPDGSLPAARAEAQAVHTLLGAGDPMLIGSAASLSDFEHDALKSRIVHMATHGIMDSEHPENSYLLMAHNTRLDVVDVQTLNLSNTDLVVLSACETGVGTNGLELATMARAFAHADVPTVMATLWSVNDAATRELIIRFYENYRREADSFTALAMAQRAMLQGDEALRRPEAWAGFEVFGKP